MTTDTLQDYHEFVKSLLSDKVVAFHPNLARACGGAKVGIMLGQLLYWNFNETAQERGGWFYKTAEQFEEETTLTKEEQATARNILGTLLPWGGRILETSLRGIPPKHWYRVNLDSLAEVIGAHNRQGFTLKKKRAVQERGEKGLFSKPSMDGNA